MHRRGLQATTLCALMRLPSDGRERAEQRALKLGYLKVNQILVRHAEMSSIFTSLRRCKDLILSEVELR